MRSPLPNQSKDIERTSVILRMTWLWFAGLCFLALFICQLFAAAIGNGGPIMPQDSCWAKAGMKQNVAIHSKWTLTSQVRKQKQVDHCFDHENIKTTVTVSWHASLHFSKTLLNGSNRFTHSIPCNWQEGEDGNIRSVTLGSLATWLQLIAADCFHSSDSPFADQKWFRMKKEEQVEHIPDRLA